MAPPEIDGHKWDWTIGRIIGPFGIKGEIKVHLETDFPERFSRLKVVALRREGRQPVPFHVISSRLHKGMVLLRLQGFETIEQVDLWRGALVQIDRVNAVPLAKDEHYISDLIGIEVVTIAGKHLGQVDDILPYPAYDMYKVGDILIPAVKQIVVELDTVSRKMVVDPPVGMLPGDEETE